MEDVKKGDKLNILKTYKTRGFLLEANEKVDHDFGAFDSRAHTPLLIEVHTGEKFVALSDARENQVYIESSLDGQLYACILQPDTYELA